MAMMMINFYHPDGRFLCGYDEAHTFPGERKATIELLAYENGIQAQEITVKREKYRKSKGAKR